MSKTQATKRGSRAKPTELPDNRSPSEILAEMELLNKDINKHLKSLKKLVNVNVEKNSK